MMPVRWAYIIHLNRWYYCVQVSMSPTMSADIDHIDANELIDFRANIIPLNKPPKQNNIIICAYAQLSVDLICFCTFKLVNTDMSDMLPMQFSAKFKCSNSWFVFKCSIDLILLPCKFKCFRCVRSFSPSIVKILLLLKFNSCKKCNRYTPYMRNKLFLCNESYENEMYLLNLMCDGRAPYPVNEQTYLFDAQIRIDVVNFL